MSSLRTARWTGGEIVPDAAILGMRVEAGCLSARLPDGRTLRSAGPLPGFDASIDIRDTAMLRRILWSGEIGFAEAYIRGEWDSPDLVGLLAFLAQNRAGLESLARPHPLVALRMRLRHLMHRNTASGAQRNIAAHYDLGTRFFAAWLDPTLTYSAAVFASAEEDLETAQRRKYRLVAEAGDLREGQRVLEIGCGWGGFALHAAREVGCQVTALTLSGEQFHHVSRLVSAEGMENRICVKLLDYRAERGIYDRIVSIEMIEAVGEAYRPLYFDRLRALLKAGGRVALQAITIAEADYPRYRGRMDFIRSHVFPGGALPTAEIVRALARRSGFVVAAEHAFGQDYARTLALWRIRFGLAWPDIRAQGFDDRFRRLWEFYLAYCEAGFRTGPLDVRRFVLEKAD